MMACNVAIESPANKTVEKFYCKIRHKGKDSKSGVGSFTKSVVTCHKYGKMYIKRIAYIIEMVLMGNCTGNKQEIFQNGSPRSL